MKGSDCTVDVKGSGIIYQGFRMWWTVSAVEEKGTVEMGGFVSWREGFLL